MSTSKFFQRPTKLHEPVGLVQFVVFEKINECLFISKLHEKNCTSAKITYLNPTNDFVYSVKITADD